MKILRDDGRVIRMELRLRNDVFKKRKRDDGGGEGFTENIQLLLDERIRKGDSFINVNALFNDLKKVFIKLPQLFRIVEIKSRKKMDVIFGCIQMMQFL